MKYHPRNVRVYWHQHLKSDNCGKIFKKPLLDARGKPENAEKKLAKAKMDWKTNNTYSACTGDQNCIQCKWCKESTAFQTTLNL